MRRLRIMFLINLVLGGCWTPPPAVMVEINSDPPGATIRRLTINLYSPSASVSSMHVDKEEAWTTPCVIPVIPRPGYSRHCSFIATLPGYESKRFVVREVNHSLSHQAWLQGEYTRETQHDWEAENLTSSDKTKKMVVLTPTLSTSISLRRQRDSDHAAELSALRAEKAAWDKQRAAAKADGERRDAEIKELRLKDPALEALKDPRSWFKPQMSKRDIEQHLRSGFIKQHIVLETSTKLVIKYYDSMKVTANGRLISINQVPPYHGMTFSFDQVGADWIAVDWRR